MRTFRDPKTGILLRRDLVAKGGLPREKEMADIAKAAFLAVIRKKQGDASYAMYENWWREQLIMKNLRELRDLALKVSTYARGYR